MICIYHSIDLDGWASAAIVLKKYPEVKLFGYDYGQKVPNIPEDTEIILTDISFPMEEMKKLKSKFKKVIWIDHHISAIKKFQKTFTKEESSEFITEFPKTNELISACELTWRYLYPDIEKPDSIELLGSYDSFRHKEANQKFTEDETMNYQYGARSKASSPESCYDVIFKDDIHDIMADGKIIFNYLKIEARNAYEKLSFPMMIGGKKFIAVNADRLNFKTFGIDYHADGYDGQACFRFQDKIWKFSIYNENGKIDCSEIAKKYGGGGHNGAAGFQLKKLPF